MTKPTWACLWLIIMLSFGAESYAQDIDRGLTAYWNFDESGFQGSANQLATARAETLVIQGHRSTGLWLTGDSDYLEMDGSVLPQGDYTLAFWFKPDNPSDKQALAVQYFYKHGGLEVFFELLMVNQSLLLRYNDGTVIKLPANQLLSNEWAFAAIRLQGDILSLSLGTEQGFPTQRARIQPMLSSQMGQLLWGWAEGKESFFTGKLDEIMVYNRALTPADMNQLFIGDNPEALVYNAAPTDYSLDTNAAYDEYAVSAVELQMATPEYINSDHNLNARRYYLQRNITSNATSLILELYDYAQFDHDSVSIFLNNQLIADNIQVPPRGEPAFLRLNLQAGQLNHLVFVAMNKGKGGGCTTMARIWNQRKQLFSEKLIITYKTNAVVAINYKVPTSPAIEVAHTLETETEDLVLEVWDHNIDDSDYISVYCNGEVLLNYVELKEARRIIPLRLSRDQINRLVFVSEDNGRIGENTARVRILANGNLLDEFTMRSNFTRSSAIDIKLVKSAANPLSLHNNK